MITGQDIFIAWAYAGVVLGVLGLVGYAVVDARRVRARLAALELRGVRRRAGDR